MGDEEGGSEERLLTREGAGLGCYHHSSNGGHDHHAAATTTTLVKRRCALASMEVLRIARLNVIAIRRGVGGDDGWGGLAARNRDGGNQRGGDDNGGKCNSNNGECNGDKDHKNLTSEESAGLLLHPSPALVASAVRSHEQATSVVTLHVWQQQR